MRFVLMLLLPCALAGETVVSATVDCGNGPVGGSGALSAGCDNGPYDSSAVALVSLAFPGVSVDVVGQFPISSAGRTVPSASAFLDADYVVTITGSTGIGFYTPCLDVYGDSDSAAYGEADAAATWNGLMLSQEGYGSARPCLLPDGGIFPFTFGQPFIVDATFSATATGGGGGVELLGFAVTDVNENPISASVTVSLVPEPDTTLLLIPALAWLLVWRIRLSCRKLAHGKS